MGNTPGKQRPSKYVHWDTAVTPAPPGKPHLVPGTPHTQPDVVTIRWEPPVNDGGAPVTGYLVEHRRTGSPHWVRATPSLVPIPELTLSGLEPGWRYQFRVSAQNVVGLSEPGDVSEPLTVTLNRSSTASPYFLQELHDVVALENDTAEFRVVFRGNPAPKISWYKDGFEIFSSRRMRVVTEGDHSALIIYQSGFSDEGDIKCTATNRAGHIVTKARLRLEAPPRVRLPRQYEEGLLFELGEVIRLKVSVAGRPLPRVTWYHNGEPVAFGGRYEVMNTERASALRVAEARRADRGEYQVRATSRLGEDQANFLVTVTDRPTPPGRAKVISTEGRIVKLTWTEPDDDGGCKIGNYIVEYYRIGWNVWLKAATCRQLSTTLDDLIEGSEYKFRVKAENPYGVSDPSEESQVIFIPDPRRGLLEPPARKKTGTRSATLPADSAKRKETSQHAALPPAKKVQGRGWETRDRPLPVISFDRVEVLDGSAEKKRKDVDEAPPPVPPKTLRRANRVDGQPLPPQRQKAVTLPPGASLQETQQETPSYAQATPKAKAAPATSNARGRAVHAGQQQQQQGDTKAKARTEPPAPPSRVHQPSLPHQSPLTPREEDDSLLHGSSELMLVLLPQSSVEGDDEEEGAERPSKEEEEEEKRRERAAAFGQDGLQEGVAPPLSLSAPELGSGEPPFPALRNAVSSTELLHERAMARFYQAVAAEEAAKALERRRSIEGALPPPPPSTPRPRGASLSDEEEIRRILRPRLSLPSAQQQEQPPTPQLTHAQARPRPPSPVAPRPPPPRSPPPPPLQSQRSEEEEEEDGFARLRERLRDAPGGRLPRHPPPPRLDSDESHDSDADAYLTGLSGEVSGDASIDLEDEEPEEEPEEELEEEPEPVRNRPAFRSRYSEDDEELEEAVETDTYHPRFMVPRAVVEGPVAVGAAPLAQPERSPPSLRPGAPSALARTALPEEPPPPVPPHARSPLPTPPIVVPKPILKKPRSPSPEQPISPPPRSPLSRSPPLSPSRSPPLSPRSRSPLLRSPVPRSPSPPSPSPSSPTPSTTFSSPRPFSPISRSPFFARSLQGLSPPPVSPRELSPPSRPFSPPLLATDDPEMERRRRRSPAPAPEPVPVAPESTPVSRRQSRQASLEEEEAITLKAVSGLYGDIIERHARGPRPKKLYISTAELKAAAEHQPRPLLPPKSSALAPKVPAPPKPKEAEPPPTPPPPPAPTLFERLGTLWVWMTGADEESYPDSEEQTKKKPVEKSEEESEEEEEEEEEPPAKAPVPIPKKAPPAPIPRLVRSVTPPPVLTSDPTPAPAAASRADAEDAPADTLDDVTSEAPATEPPAPAAARLPLVRPLSPEEEEAIRKVTEKKVRSTIEYLTDVAMFSVACWLYVFEDELYAVPVLLLMVYRQLRDAIHCRIPRFLRRSSS